MSAPKTLWLYLSNPPLERQTPLIAGADLAELDLKVLGREAMLLFLGDLCFSSLPRGQALVSVSSTAQEGCERPRASGGQKCQNSVPTSQDQGQQQS